MQWIRIRPTLANWPTGGRPPLFEIDADAGGDVVVELAWDTAAIRSPARYEATPLRYFCTSAGLELPSVAGAAAVVIPPQRIALVGRRAWWQVPEALWRAHQQEQVRQGTTFGGCLYYRARGSSDGREALVWPTDALIEAQGADAPHLGLLRAPPANTPRLPWSTDPALDVLVDEAVEAMGGLPVWAPDLYSRALRAVWAALPPGDVEATSLTSLFAAPGFRSALTQKVHRACLLTLWLSGGPEARLRVHELLGRTVRTAAPGAAPQTADVPLLLHRDATEGQTCLRNLLDLKDVAVGPDVNAWLGAELTVDDVLLDVIDPPWQTARGWPGDAGLVRGEPGVPTAVLGLLARCRPSEVARLHAGLLSWRAAAPMQGGDTLTLPPGALRLARYQHVASRFDFAGYGELAFHAAALRYAQGEAFPPIEADVPAESPGHVSRALVAAIDRGLTPAETATLLGQVFGCTFTPHYLGGDLHDPTITATAGAARHGSAQATLADGLLAALDAPGRTAPVLVSLFWTGPYRGSQLVLATAHTAGRVSFHVPRYSGGAPPPGVVAGAQSAPGDGPPRRFDDPTTTLESVTDDVLATWIRGYQLPDRNL